MNIAGILEYCSERGDSDEIFVATNFSILNAQEWAESSIKILRTGLL